MSALTYTFDTSDFRTKAVGTRRIMAVGTKRAVQIAGDAGAVRARSDYKHTKRTGRLTSAAELRFEMRGADESGSWGYLINYTPYGAYVEYGTKAHKIYPKAGHGMIGPTREGQTRRATGKGPHEYIVGRGIALRFRVGGRIVFARMVNHPGTQGTHWMRDAAEYAGTVLVRETESWTFVQIAKLWDS